MVLVERQFLQRRERWVAFDERVEAPITIPGIRTNLEMVFAYKSAEECMVMYIQIANGGHVFIRVEYDLTIWDGSPARFASSNLSRNEKNLLQRVFLDGRFKLKVSHVGFCIPKEGYRQVHS